MCVLAPRVYSFPLFTPAFCERFLEELEHFEQSEVPKGRPNTMNNTGVSDSKANAYGHSSRLKMSVGHRMYAFDDIRSLVQLSKSYTPDTVP